MEIFETAQAHWRGSAADKARCPYSIFTMRHGEVVSPRGVAFHPQLVEGPSTNCTFAECKDLVEGALREILDSFQACPPVFYLGSTTDLLWRWRDIKESRTIGGTSAATRSANRTAGGRSWSSTSRSQGATAPQWRNT